LIEVSRFLKSLIIEVVNFDQSAPIDERQELIIRLLLQEVWRMPDAPYKIGMPRDTRLRLACQVVIDDPAANIGLDELAEIACMSRRTFTRIFRKEAGTSFGDWRRQVRLMEALSLLEAGHSATMTAYDVGYSSLSAFSAAFRRVFGVSPSKSCDP
jgi:AraC-like DNA-binding protein